MSSPQPSTAVRSIAGAGIPFAILMVIALATSIPFVYNGFATGDSMQYALGLERMLHNGFGNVGSEFNGDMGLGYYMILYCLHAVLGGAVPISAMMNMLSAITSVIMQAVLFVLLYRLTQNSRVALFACLATLISPSVWMHGHFGHPVLIGLTLFLSAMLTLDGIACSGGMVRRELLRWMLFLFFAAAAALVRLDIILAYGAFFGLLFYRRSFSLSRLAKTLGVLLLAGIIVLGIHWIALGKLVAPGGQALTYHVANRLGTKAILSNSLKNIVLLAFAVNALMLLLAVIGFVRYGTRSRLWALVLAWVLPWCVFLPFQGMDFSRIAIPAIPPLMLMATGLVDDAVKSRKTLALAGMIVVAQVVAIGLYYPLATWYPFKVHFEGRVMATVPLGFPPEDQLYRQRMIAVRDSTAERVAGETRSNVLVVSFTGRAIYEYWLHHTRTIVEDRSTVCNGVMIDRLTTPDNVFTIVDLELNAGVPKPVSKLVSCLEPPAPLIHIAPFSELPSMANDSLFHSAPAALRILHE